MRHAIFIRGLAVALVAACGVALTAVLAPGRLAVHAGHAGTRGQLSAAASYTGGPDAPREGLAGRVGGTRMPLAVAWRVPLGVRAGRPRATAGGWVVADSAGGVLKVSKEGRVLWRSSFSNEAFAGASEIAGGRVAVASESGRVFCLDGETGAELWRRLADARFQHAPLAGLRGEEPVLWLVSQEDGRLFCLRAIDGAVVWTADPTNRCDGEPAAWPGRIAYGNCDGAVYVFDALGGKLLGKVEVGEEDQMAGGLLALPDGRLVTGTRSGRLVLVDPVTLTCVASVKVSESEAFVTPVGLWLPNHVAMGVEEGAVRIWKCQDNALHEAGQLVAAGAAVAGLASEGRRLFVLAGGELSVFNGEEIGGKIVLGDEVGGLSADSAGDAVCVADGVLVCVKGGGR